MNGMDPLAGAGGPPGPGMPPAPRGLAPPSQPNAQQPSAGALSWSHPPGVPGTVPPPISQAQQQPPPPMPTTQTSASVGGGGGTGPGSLPGDMKKTYDTLGLQYPGPNQSLGGMPNTQIQG